MVEAALESGRRELHGGGQAVAWLACAALAASSLLLSFRLPFATLDAAWQANGARMLCAAALGLGLAASAALRQPLRKPLFEAYLFASAIGAVAGSAVFAKWIGGPAAVGLGAVLGAALAWGLVRLCDRPRRAANLLLALVLSLLLAVGLVSALIAATERGGADVLAAWLLGDLSLASAGLPLVALLVTAGLAVTCARWSGRALDPTSSMAGAGSLLLFALAVGIGGPVAFVGGFAAALVGRLVGRRTSEPAPVLLCGFAGAALVMAADALPRALIGGYAPPLNLAIAVPAVPGFLWWNRRRLRALGSGRAGLAFELGEAALIAAISLAIALVVYALASYARSAT